MEIFSNMPLKSYNTFGFKVFADQFAIVENVDDLIRLSEIHNERSRPMLVLGGGSNVLFTGDYKGIVLKINLKGKEVVEESEEYVWLKAAAGEEWDGLVDYCVERGWAGLENLSGIPGQVGSSPIQNIGAYGSEMKDHFISLEAIDLCTGTKSEFDPERCRFGYRDSIFKRALKGRVVITHVTFRLDKKPSFNLSYKTLKEALGHIPESSLSIAQIREAVLKIRASKLPDPKITGNAGSFFKNPVVSPAQLDQLKEKFPGVAYFSAPGNGFRNSNIENQTVDCLPPTAGCKLAAGWLIEHCGWKGYREGDAGVHPDQALVLINYGNANGIDILTLAEKIRLSVMEKFGVMLEKEVNVI
jgi:UDP-N-acetylmuramate dehydrogenase